MGQTPPPPWRKARSAPAVANALGAQKNTPCHNIPYYKICICIPCRNIAAHRWCPDRGPVINIVGWEPLGSNPVINVVARQ